MTKSVKIENPTAAPVADFIATSNQVEVFYSTSMLDLSTNGPTAWTWDAISPTGAKSIYYTQTPNIQFTELGWWDVCLTTSNTKLVNTLISFAEASWITTIFSFMLESIILFNVHFFS